MTYKKQYKPNLFHFPSFYHTPIQKKTRPAFLPLLPPAHTKRAFPTHGERPSFLLIEVEFFGNCFAVFYFDGDGVLHLILE